MPSLSELVRYRTPENGDAVMISIKGALAERVRFIGATCPASMHPHKEGEAFAFCPEKGVDGFVVFAVSYRPFRNVEVLEFLREYRWRDGIPIVLNEPYCPRPGFAVIGQGYHVEVILPDGRKVSNVQYKEENREGGRILVVPLQGGTEAVCRYAYEQSDENLASLLGWAGDPDAKRQAEQINEAERLRRLLSDREEALEQSLKKYCRAKTILAMLWTRVTGTPFPTTFFEDFPDGEITEEALDQYVTLKKTRHGVLDSLRRFLLQIRMTS